MGYYVYVLVNPERNTYSGQTEDLPRRLAEHNDPECRLSRYTKVHKGTWRLLYREECATRRKAIKREKQLKTGSGRRFIQSLLQDESG